MNDKLNYESKTFIMGIINVTPDSFSGDGLLQEGFTFVDLAIKKAHRFIGANVDILDIGGESTRPGATPVPEEEELYRILPVIKAIREHYSIPISIDTTKASVAKAALAAGANIINDVSGLMMDSGMADVAINFDVPVILMHNAQPENHTRSEDITTNVIEDLEILINHAITRGIQHHQIILDPGIGFKETQHENLVILNNLDRIKRLGYPILLGVSRKSFIGHLTHAPVTKRLPGSIAAATIGIMKGANIIRVHDVEETVQAIQVIDAIRIAG